MAPRDDCRGGRALLYSPDALTPTLPKGEGEDVEGRPGMRPAIFLIGPQPRILRLRSGHAAILAGQEKRGDHHPKTDVVVPVVRVVPVAVRTADVPLIVVERAAAQHTVIHGHIPATAAKPRVAYCVTFRQPPSRRPISATMFATCWYWPCESHSHLAARRR